MGWTVLYIAFGVVALWLLGEVLLQYKARLRWRLVAFAGFLGVVLGVLTRSVVIIGLGAAAFTLGQTFVTLSFRRGFVAGWAVKRPDDEPEPEAMGGSKRRRGGRGSRLNDPVLDAAGYDPQEQEYDEGPAYGRDNAPAYGQDDYQDRDDVFTPTRSADPTAAETTNVYEPQPIPEDTGSYGVYGADGTNGQGTDYAAATADYAAANGEAAYATAGQDQAYATAAQGTDQNYAYDYSGYGQQQYGYDASGQQQYAGYTDQYGNAQNYGASYDAYGNQQQYTQQGYGQGQYTGGYGETPADGVWVPQQRTDENYGEVPPEQQQYGYQQNNGQQANGQQNNGQQGNGYDEQYRF
ncbi:hypothetical protein [Streptomyces mangrovisoli]|uniref:Uncharacterized protein n=1 Tax=Streptomyces mangrovisoli TaxID=1428628 RepID=A0A1J4P2H0_9ACTN|nr:hypothetical protein [Streptomyces mangrovisoli]OIJ68768.1 hypothetical protein WN71_006110 [Streptomyces mangrovisoli]